jgi:hypothetical protein
MEAAEGIPAMDSELPVTIIICMAVDNNTTRAYDVQVTDYVYILQF